MLDWLRKLLELDAEAAIELSEGEKILYVIGRHWVVLLTRMILPFLGVLFFSGLASYRAIGGAFLVYRSEQPIGFDPLNWILALVAGGLLVVWFILYARGAKTRQTRTVLLGVVGVIALLIYYRYTGGRVFAIEPDLAISQRGDFFNLVLIILAIASAFMITFVFYDWLNDELILTNRRVVFDNDLVFIPRLLERRVQQQIFLEDVQDVSAQTKTYPQHWLGYGTIVIKSARFGGNIIFESASRPMEMQKRIMEQVRDLRKRMSDFDYRRMVDERVYGKKPSSNQQALSRQAASSARLLTWLIPENPEFDEKTRWYTWRPHWLFLLQAQLGPLILLVAGLFGVALLASLAELGAGWVFLATAVVVVGYLLWAAWEWEDYRNDKYILTPTNVIDIEKKPFGPEDQRQASLGAITNVRFETTLISNLLGYGDVILETAGAGGKFTFLHVPRPQRVVMTINEYIVNFRRGEREKTLNDVLDLLAYYHEAQKRYGEINPSA